MSAGKGDKLRPIDKKTFDNNFDKINWQCKNLQPNHTVEKKVSKNKVIYKYK